MNKKERIEWIDILKGVTVLLVALSHSINVAYINTGIESPAPIFDLIILKLDWFLGMARMPAFFLAGGIVMSSLTRNKAEWFLTKRLPFMVWLIIIWTAISIFTEASGLHLYPAENHPYFLNGYEFPSPYGNLWFVYALLLLSGFAVILDQFKRSFQIYTVVTFSIGLHYYLDIHEFDAPINKLLITNLCYKGLPFFIAGFIFKSHLQNLFNKNRLTLFLLSLFSVFCVIIYKILLGKKLIYGGLFLQFIPATLVFVSFLVTIYKVRFINFLFKGIGQYSLEFFILHQFFIASFYATYRAFDINIDYISNKILLILMPSLLCFIFIKYSNKYLKEIFFSVPKPILLPIQAYYSKQRD
jgi:surface polysaccharide O-acyltransferase-like enzyme